MYILRYFSHIYWRFKPDLIGIESGFRRKNGWNDTIIYGWKKKTCNLEMN